MIAIIVKKKYEKNGNYMKVEKETKVKIDVIDKLYKWVIKLLGI